jgi:hypothetical protein
MISDDIKCSRNPIQYESNPNTNTNTNPTRARTSDRFEKFWSAYPRHEAKQNALKAFEKINPDDELLELVKLIASGEGLFVWRGDEQ